MSENIAPTVGQFLYSSWGYEQTNIDFYKIVRVMKTQVELQPWSQTWNERTGDMSETVVPGDTPLMVRKFSQIYSHDLHENLNREWIESVSPVIRKKWQQAWNGVSINSYANAYTYDGKPKHQSHYA
jgi:hypothetical protein